MVISHEDIERAKNLWLANFFSWSDDWSENEVDSAGEGFLSGVNWTLKQLGIKIQDGKSNN